MQLVKDLSKLMQGELEMSLMEDLTYFVKPQIKQLKEEHLYVNQNIAKSCLNASK